MQITHFFFPFENALHSISLREDNQIFCINQCNVSTMPCDWVMIDQKTWMTNLPQDQRLSIWSSWKLISFVSVSCFSCPMRSSTSFFHARRSQLLCWLGSRKIKTPGEQENGDGDNTRRRMEYLKIRVQRPDGEIIFIIIVIIMSAEISTQLLNGPNNQQAHLHIKTQCLMEYVEVDAKRIKSNHHKSDSTKGTLSTHT